MSIDTPHTHRRDAGMAVLGALLVLVLMAGIASGLMALAVTDARVRAADGTRVQAFYTAHAGLEKLTADLGDLFSATVAPTGAQIAALGNLPPNLGNANWLEPDGADGYRIQFPTDGGGNPTASVTTVMSGPFQGLVGLATPYEMRVTARLVDRSEASLTRTLQTIAIPVFQFGFFSENDLSFFAGPDFNFGGRVHSNSNLYLAAGSQLTLSERVTAVGDVIRTNLSNGWDTGNGYTGNVRVSTAPNAYRNLQRNEGSLIGTAGSAVNEPVWTNLSTGAYNSNITNGRTGARRLDLPVTTYGAAPIDLVRRPVVNEHVTNPNVLGERFFSLASLRILLSDTASDITNLPTVTGTAPVDLGQVSGTSVVEPAWYTIGDATPHFAESAGIQQGGDSSTSQRYGSRTPTGRPLLGGFIKIEQQTTPGTWVDVTQQILMLGIAGRQSPNPGSGNPNCADPSPNAVIRLQRHRDRDAGCWSSQSATARRNGRNFSPMVLYDTREAVFRDGYNDNAPMLFGGIMHYIEIDARNLSRWFQGAIGTTGAQSLNVNGYTVYISDRRTNRNGANQETGEYGFEDVVNPLSVGGWPNGSLDVGEDFNGNGQLDTYGQVPRPLVAGMTAPFTGAARPWTSVDPAGNLSSAERQALATRNPALFYRRAVKLVNGGAGNLVAPGLTIASENPVYVQGNWNANTNSFPAQHVATAVLADAVTLLSNAWNDRRSLQDPHNQSPRAGTQTSYRFAVISGKGLSFPHVSGTYQDFGTDGGAHNFLRYLEDWGGAQLNYRGSIASFFYSRQAVGTYKCCSDVYSPPTRGYAFDTDFLTPALLPPRTPMFRDVNTTGFAQIIRAR
jgi:hypothetical protein